MRIPAIAITAALGICVGMALASDECADWNTRAIGDDYEVPELLACLKRGANPNARDATGYSRLHWVALASKDPVMIETLIAAGADVNAQDVFGRIPLHRAASYNDNPAMHEALIAAGANVNARDSKDETPLHKASKENGNPDVLEVLLRAGAKPNILNKQGKTPLDLANRALTGGKGTDAYRQLESATNPRN